MRQQAHQRDGQARLAAAGFADDAQRLALGEIEGDAVDGAQRATLGGVLDGQVADFEQGHQSRRSLGLTIGSMASASSMKVMAVMTMSRPGETTHHQ